MNTIYLNTFYPLYIHSEFANRQLEIVVLASNECPMCGYAMDFNEDCYRNFHDLNTNEQKNLKFFLYTFALIAIKALLLNTQLKTMVTVSKKNYKKVTSIQLVKQEKKKNYVIFLPIFTIYIVNV